MFFLALFLFVMGLVWGSFLNVVIYRVSQGESPLRGRSKCTWCKKQLSWFHTVPLLSFIWLKGKCAFCKKKISWQYPAVEFLTGLLFVWWYFMGSGFFALAGRPYELIQPLFWLLVGMLLLVVFVADWRFGVIPDVINLSLFSLSLLYRLVLVSGARMQMVDFWNSLGAGVGLVAFFVALWLLTKKRGFGMGDVKLAPALGILLGWPRTLVGVFLAFLIGAVVAVVLLVWGKKKLGQTLPFGPFLVLGTALALLWGSQIWSWYLSLLY